jgi:pimeloyl-ACP methyl ester carboxylesterase
MAEWYLLPGMGASAAMYNALKRNVPFDINYISWPIYSGEKTYADIALRIIQENNISNGDIIGGSSLGGMVALEMTKMIEPRAIVLLGSALHPKEVQKLLTLLSPFAEITPIDFLRMVLGKFSPLVNSVFSQTDTEFIRAMSLYLPLWSGYSGPTDAIYRLHGRKDHIIPCPTKECEIVEEAGHLLPITHAKETSAFLQRVRERIVA